MEKKIVKLMVSLLVVIFVFTITTTTSIFAKTEMTSAKKTAISWVDNNSKKIIAISNAIFNYAELGWQEFKSAEEIRAFLKENGFKVKNVPGLPTAINASWGSGKPVIGFNGEYDGLPMLSQKAGATTKVPKVSIGDEVGPGHGCGHNLYGTGSAAAVVAITKAMKKHGIKGTIKFHGCPAEEILEGKVFMAAKGLFSDCDAVLSWHPGDKTMFAASPCLALVSVKYSFVGKTAHAGTSPEHGRSALDAAMITDVAANYIREHMVEADRIQCVLPKGGMQPNVVPDYAELWYFLRSPTVEEGVDLLKRVTNCAKAGALATDTKMTRKIITNTWPSLPNIRLAQLGWDNFQLVGQPDFTAKEIKYAKDLQKNSGMAVKGINMRVIPPVRPTKPGKQGRWSTDAGNVSWLAPFCSYRVVTLVAGTPGHSWQYVSTVGSSIGHKGMLRTIKVLAMAGIDMLTNPEIIQQVRKEWNERRGGKKYYVVFPEIAPSLDYFAPEMSKWIPLQKKYYKPVYK